MADWFSFRKSNKSKSPGAGEADPVENALTPEERAELERKREESIRLERKWFQLTYNFLSQRTDPSEILKMSDAQALMQIRNAVNGFLEAQEASLTAEMREQIFNRVKSEILGLGPLDILLDDPTISDIMVNGSKQIYVESKGKLKLCDVTFEDDQHLMRIIERIVASVGRRIDRYNPMVDARLKDGSRVNVIIPPLSLDGPMMSIRRFTVDKLDVEKLKEMGSLNDAIAKVLEAIVKLRLNVLVSGGTGSGKTTLLNILSGFIPANERIVTIEDSAELQLQQPHVIRLETCPPELDGRGEVTQRDLVKNCLRMRPDRIVIGEVRGTEVMDMLQAMNSGHDGSLATIHANTPRDAMARVENMVALAGFNFPTAALRSYIASAIDIVVQIQRMEDGSRRIVSIAEIEGMEGDIITMAEIFRFIQTSVDEDGKVCGKYCATGIVPSFYRKLKPRGIELSHTVFQDEE